MAKDADQRDTAGLAADCLADVAEEREDLPLAQSYIAQVLTLTAPDDYDDRFLALRRMRDISLKRAAADPRHPWWEALHRLAESADDLWLSAACYQTLGEIAADREERQAESWLQKSLELWGDSADLDISLGRKATRRRLLGMIAHDPDRRGRDGDTSRPEYSGVTRRGPLPLPLLSDGYRPVEDLAREHER